MLRRGGRNDDVSDLAHAFRVDLHGVRREIETSGDAWSNDDSGVFRLPENVNANEIKCALHSAWSFSS
ncbi:hypothetical protein HAX54_009973 [Datura stramonium]|uniref:Uncharacterized protein n=1 Tax=Datura stramonium TaxID=4076 RepID=A0ABS8THD8_DATST|nr:hypothetical protein [Datura stramonium]